MNTGWAVAGALSCLLPPGVVVADSYSNATNEPLHPSEVAYLLRAVPRRRAEFTAVRACARAALAQLGLVRPPMVPGDYGEPVWPPLIVGALTHCAGYQAAAVASTQYARSIGIDAEPHAPLPEGVLAHVATSAEQRHLGELTHTYPGICWATVLFSAKESVYKAWFPLTRRWLGFHDVHLVIDPEREVFTADVLTAVSTAQAVPCRFHGRWTVHGDHVLTAVYVPVPLEHPRG